MKFRVTRSSMYSAFNPDYKPCEGVYISSLPKLTTDERNLPTFSAFDAQNGAREGAWCSKGINHREESGRILREVPQKGKGWYIKITSLKALKEFISEQGECVLSEIDGELVIEIYDDYRE